MWIKKTEEELKQDLISKQKAETKERIIVTLLTIICGFVVYVFSRMTGFGPFIDRKPITLTEVFDELPHTILSISIMIVFVVIYALIFRVPFRNPEPKLFICQKCNEKKYNVKENIQCECGGTFDDADKLKWVENE